MNKTYISIQPIHRAMRSNPYRYEPRGSLERIKSTLIGIRFLDTPENSPYRHLYVPAGIVNEATVNLEMPNILEVEYLRVTRPDLSDDEMLFIEMQFQRDLIAYYAMHLSGESPIEVFAGVDALMEFDVEHDYESMREVIESTYLDMGAKDLYSRSVRDAIARHTRPRLTNTEHFAKHLTHLATLSSVDKSILCAVESVGPFVLYRQLEIAVGTIKTTPALAYKEFLEYLPHWIVEAEVKPTYEASFSMFGLFSDNTTYESDCTFAKKQFKLHVLYLRNRAYGDSVICHDVASIEADSVKLCGDGAPFDVLANHTQLTW